MEEKILYKNFIKDKRVYNLNSGYWRTKLQKTLAQKISNEDFLFLNKNLEGYNYYDANPIFSFYDKKKNRAIRIIQDEVESVSQLRKNELIDAWFDKIEIQRLNNEPKSVNELVIALVLTPYSVGKCLEISKRWILSELGENELEIILDKE